MSCFGDELPARLRHCLEYSFGGTEKEHHSPPLTSKQLVYNGDLGFDSYVNQMVETAVIRRKLHVSRPGAILWSGDQDQGLYYPRLTLVSASPTQVLLLGAKTH